MSKVILSKSVPVVNFVAEGKAHSHGSPVKPLYDLVICSRKVDQEGRILWMKFAFEPKSRKPERRDMEISHPTIMALLADYELVATEKHPGQIVRKYRAAI